jgi:hypothetical protein
MRSHSMRHETAPLRVFHFRSVVSLRCFCLQSFSCVCWSLFNVVCLCVVNIFRLFHPLDFHSSSGESVHRIVLLVTSLYCLISVCSCAVTKSLSNPSPCATNSILFSFRSVLSFIQLFLSTLSCPSAPY